MVKVSERYGLRLFVSDLDIASRGKYGLLCCRTFGYRSAFVHLARLFYAGEFQEVNFAAVGFVAASVVMADVVAVGLIAVGVVSAIVFGCMCRDGCSPQKREEEKCKLSGEAVC